MYSTTFVQVYVILSGIAEWSKMNDKNIHCTNLAVDFV